jgi:peptide/nickel transport system permease protein
MRYLLRRISHAVLLLFGVSLLTFLLTTLTPGNYFDEMRLNPQLSPETLKALRAKYQLDRPLPLRYAQWAKSVLRGDLGFSFTYNAPLAPLLWVRARNTLLLTTTAIILAWAISLPLGIWSAEHRGQLSDRGLSWIVAALLVIPELTLALGLLVFAVRTRWLPAGGMTSMSFDSLAWPARVGNVAVHMILPVTVLVLGALPVLLRHVRSAVIDVLDAPFLRAAEGHGISRRRLLYRYVLPAAANPMVSLFGSSVGTLLSASLLVEIVMSWPGLGPFLVEAILARDLYVVVAGVLLSTVFLVGGNLIADLLLYWVDPRIRAGLDAR